MDDPRDQRIAELEAENAELRKRIAQLVAPKPMLVNLKDDIGETKDLSAAHPEQVKKLTEAWQKWNASLKPPAWLHHSLQKPKK